MCMKLLRLFLAFVLVLPFVFVNFAESYFSDLEGVDYVDNILSLSDQEIIEGYDDGTFRPQGEINRAEMMKMVMAARFDDAEDYAGDCFEDVNDDWFAPYICRGKDLTVVKGYDDGLFRPDDPTTMVEAFKIILETFELELEPLEEGDEWFWAYREFVHNNGILSKFGYNPNRAITRAEVALIVDSVLKIQSGEHVLNEVAIFSSSGCGSVAPASAPETFTVNGQSRSTITVVPDSYNKDEPLDVIFAFHGRTSPNWQVQQYFRLETPVQGKAIIVYPQARSNNGSHYWTGDSEFFDEILNNLSDNYCINKDRVFVLGHSLGSSFANDLACVRGDAIRAVASLGGAGSNISECTGRVAAMQFHNPNDQLASYTSATYTRDWYLGRNECSNESFAIEPFWGECQSYIGCKEFSPYLWCPHEVNYDEYSGAYYPHTWPKATGEAMWKFFKSLE
jgi:polyhydroxybutyrate depolymerase